MSWQNNPPKKNLENALLVDLNNNPHLFYAEDFKKLYRWIPSTITKTNVTFIYRLWNLAEGLSPKLREQFLPTLYELSLENELW